MISLFTEQRERAIKNQEETIQGLWKIFNKEPEVNPTQLKLLQEIPETILRSNSLVEEKKIRNDDSFRNLEANICTVKEIFGKGIQILQEQMIDEEKLRKLANRVVEGPENG
jgi:hypothetical protein